MTTNKAGGNSRSAATITPITTTTTEPPNRIEAEQSTLGGLMLDNTTWAVVSRIVTAPDFYRADHRLIYNTIHRLADEKKPFDLISLCDQLENDNLLDDAGGWANVAVICRDTPSAANIKWYATIVRRTSLERRRLVAINKGDHDQAAAITATIKALEAGSKAAPLLPSIDDILDRTITHDWLVKGWIERRQTAVLFGESQAYKSLLAIEIACCIATGTAWRGLATKKGAVLYIVGEGAGSGITRRFLAWQIANQTPLAGHPLFFQEATTVLPDDLERLIAEVSRTLDTKGWKLELVILDTLSRTISGDERSSADFARYQRALDRLRQEFSCAAMFLHHTGHGDKSRERGASDIGCNADVRLCIEIVGEKMRRLCALKLKDAETPADMFFTLALVELGQNDDEGIPVTSVVLRQLTDYAPQQQDSSRKDARIALTALKSLYDQQQDNLTTRGYPDGQPRVTIDDWRAAFMSALPADTNSSTRRVSWKRAISDLTENGKVRIDERFVEIVSSAT